MLGKKGKKILNKSRYKEEKGIGKQKKQLN